MATTAARLEESPALIRPPYAPWYKPVPDVEHPPRDGDDDSEWDRAAAAARRGYAGRRRGDLNAAVAELRSALALFGALGDRRSALPVHCALAEIHFTSGDFDAAAAVHRRALTVCPGDPVSLIGLAYAHWYQGFFADALTLLGEALESRSEQDVARGARGQLLADLGRAPAALADLESAPDGPDTRSARALALDALCREEESDREREAALRLAPDLPRTHLRIARVQLRRGAVDAARQSLGRALAGDPPLPPAHAAQARRLLDQMARGDAD